MLTYKVKQVLDKHISHKEYLKLQLEKTLSNYNNL